MVRPQRYSGVITVVKPATLAGAADSPRSGAGGGHCVHEAVATTVFALAVSAAVAFVVLPLVPSLAMVSTAMVVLATILPAWLIRGRSAAGVARPVHIE
jgi:Flp pilus assembly protein TadB